MWIVLVCVVALCGLGLGAWWLLMLLGNDTGQDDFQHEVVLPDSEVRGLDDSALADDLVERWFDHFTTDAGWSAKLRDYRLTNVEVRRDGGRFEATVTAEVRPTRWSLDNWIAGSGGTVEDGWLRGKFLRFTIEESATNVTLRPTGPGPV
jgi:hypothetical protein